MCVYNELGTIPLQDKRYMIIIKYWLTVLKSDNCILANVYKHLYNASESCTNWATKVIIVLDYLGLSYIWHQQYVDDELHFLHVVKPRQQDHFCQDMLSFFKGSSRCFIYTHLTDNFAYSFT